MSIYLQLFEFTLVQANGIVCTFIRDEKRDASGCQFKLSFFIVFNQPSGSGFWLHCMDQKILDYQKWKLPNT